MKNYILFAFAALFLMSCNDDDNTNSSSTINLSFQNLPDLGSGYVYEGWLAVNGGVESAGRFTVNGGSLSQSSFSFPADVIDNASAYILTIEPANETGADLDSPSDVHILAGDFSGNSANLSIGDARAIGDSFMSVSGTYILATPTTATTDDELSGVWFLDPTAGPGPGLSLPTLPSGWRYEGWAVKDGVPYSSGTFSSVMGADDSSTYSGPMAGPPFPGEDFVQGNANFPTNFQGGVMVISVEPYPDDSPAPFIIKPLIGMVANDAADHTPYSMSVNQNEIPSGSISR